MEETPIHRQIWRAVQVKVMLSGNVRNQKHSLAAVLQCEAALKTPHQTSHGQVTIEQVWLIIAHPLSDSSKRYIYSTLNDNAARVLVIDGPELVDLIAEYLPGAEAPEYDTATTYIQELLAFTDSPDEFLATVFKANFRLSSIFVHPNCAIQLMDASAVEHVPACADAVDWEALRDLPLKLEALNNGILDSGSVVELRSIIAKLNELGRAMDLSRWEPLSVLTFNADLQSLSTTFESIACNPLVTREDLEGLSRGLDKFTSPRLRERNRAYEQHRNSILSRWPRPETSIVSAADEYGQLREVRKLLVTEFAEVYRKTKQISFGRLDVNETNLGRSSIEEIPSIRDPYRRGTGESESVSMLGLTEEAVVIARLLGRSPANAWSSQLSTDRVLTTQVMSLRNICSAFGAFLIDRAAEYVVNWNSLAEDLKPKLEIESYTDANLTKLVACNQLTSLFTAIFGASIPIHSYAVEALSTMKAQARIAFYGNLGMGKTTLAKQVCLQLAAERGEDPRKPLPVHVSLGTVQLPSKPEGEDQGLMEAAFLRAATRTWEGSDDHPQLQRHFILDGLDEVTDPSTRQRIVNWCAMEAARNGRLLVTARPHALPCYLPGVLRIGILPFSAADVETFVRSLPWTSASEPDELLKVIAKDRNLTEISRTPLLLTLLVIVAQLDGSRNIPSRREKVYRRIVGLMLYEWDRKKRLHRVYAIPDEDVRLAILRKLAYKFHRQGKRTFTYEALLREVVQVGPHTSETLANRYVEDLLNDCLLCPISGDLFMFFHLSIQEYLVGLELAEDTTLSRLFGALEDYFRLGAWWEEPLVFWAGIRRDISLVVNQMNDHIPMNRDEARVKVRHLIERWMDVADLTAWEKLNPRGIVAETLGEMSVAGRRELWMKLARL